MSGSSFSTVALDKAGMNRFNIAKKEAEYVFNFFFLLRVKISFIPPVFPLQGESLPVPEKV